MKLIDQTPYYTEKGELSFVDRSKAMLKFGPGWVKEMDAQKSIIAVFDKVLDKNFILLRNVEPPGLEARIPFILVGPTGVYVMYVTPSKGMFRAKGDEWGSVVGNSFKPEKPNLLIRTQRMAEAVQVYLQRQGYTEITSVEAILLCSDPSVTVDSLRPIIRVVMSDALERLAVSIAQAKVILTPESAYNIAKRLTTPAAPAAPQPTEEPPTQAIPEPVEKADENPYVPSFALPESEVPRRAEIPFAPEEDNPPAPKPRRSARPGMTRGQWIFIIILFIIWLLIMAAFAFIVYRDMFL